MKLFALSSFVAAKWNGVSNENTCGMHLLGPSMINSTCSISGSNIRYVYAGNAAFIKDSNTFVGFDGLSGTADVIVFFDQTCDDDFCDNSTCWNAELNCIDHDKPQTGVFFMDTANDHRAKVGGEINLQISGIKQGDSISFNLVDHANNPWNAANISAEFGVVSGSGSSFVIQVANEPFGDFFQVSVADDNNPAHLDLWQSTVNN